GRPARLPAEAAQDEQDAERQERVTAEVEDVGDRRRRRLPVERHLVDREDRVSRNLAEQSECEELPREALAPRQIACRPDVDRGHRGSADHHVEDGLPVRRQQEIDADRERAGAQERPCGRRGPYAAGDPGDGALDDGGTRHEVPFGTSLTLPLAPGGRPSRIGAHGGSALCSPRNPLTPQTGGRVKKRIYAGAGVSAVIAIVALVATVSGAIARSGATPLPASSCSAIQNAGGNLLIASDLPLQGSGRTQTTQMTRAIKF